MSLKSVYAIQPTLLGSKAKSLAVIIPAKVARSLGIDQSTILALKADEVTGLITLETWKPTVQENNQQVIERSASS
jgi:hypothetical protein